MKSVVIVIIFCCFYNVNCSTPEGCPYSQENTNAPIRPIKPIPAIPPIPDSQIPICTIPAPIKCLKYAQYRSFDGSCNNLVNSTWGMAKTRYRRLAQADYADGLEKPRSNSVTGNPLPFARIVSRSIFDDLSVLDPKLTAANVGFGQFIAHDMSFLTLSKISSKPCCENGVLNEKKYSPSTCPAIVVPKNDPDYSTERTECLPFTRTLTDRQMNCPGSDESEPAEQVSLVTAYLDLSNVYGNSDSANLKLRKLAHGHLIVSDLKGFSRLPISSNCGPGVKLCFESGDVRTNQNLHLVAFQSLMHKAHNTIATELAKINPGWTDHQLFEQARKINIAQYQHIVYYEYLPTMLGPKNMLTYKLIYNLKNGCSEYINDYSPHVNPAPLNEFSQAAFRYFHSQITSTVDFYDKKWNNYKSVQLSDQIGKPDELLNQKSYDNLFRGMTNQRCEAADINFTNETTLLFGKNVQSQKKLGQDLHASDIHRSRDHALRSYNDYRSYCGIRRAKTWSDFKDFMSDNVIAKLKRIYRDVNDVDLIVGGSLERHVHGSMLGPVFLCFMTEQFYSSRVGDSFFYTHKNKYSGFTQDQLCEIRKSSLAAIICDNSDSMDYIHTDVLRAPNSKTGNKRVPCSKIPRIDFTKWRDFH